MGLLDRLGWTGTSTLGVGTFLIGVRSGSDEAERAVRAAFGSRLVEGLEPQPNFSVRFEDEVDEAGVRRFNILYRSDCQVIRSRHRSRVISTLRAALARHAGEGAGLAMLRQVALVGPDGATLAPPDLLPRIEEIEDRLAEREVRVLGSGLVHLDPATGELVIPQPELPIEDEAWIEEAAAQPGTRFPVAGWTIIRREGEGLRRMDVLAALMPSLESEGDPSTRTSMRAVAKALSSASVGAIWSRDPEEILERLTGVAAGR